MRRSNRVVVGLAIVTCGCGGKGAPAVNLDDEVQAIRARGEAMLAAENARDFDTSLGMYAEDAVIHGPGMPALRGRETIRTMYQQFSAQQVPQTTGAYTERNIVVAQSGDLAWEEGGATTTMETPGGTVVESGKQLIVWKKIDGQWQVTALAWSGNSPGTAPIEAPPPGS